MGRIVEGCIIQGLRADAGLSALVGTRIYLASPQGGKSYPFCSIFTVSENRGDGIMPVGNRVGNRETLMQIDVWETDINGYESTRAIADAVVKACESQKLAGDFTDVKIYGIKNPSLVFVRYEGEYWHAVIQITVMWI